MTNREVKTHYAEVARMVRESERDPHTGFHIVREGRAACAIDSRSEALRVLAPSGRFVVSDIVEFAPVPAEVRADLCAIAGTTNGMLSADAYLALLERVGFAGAGLEPKTVYTREVLREKAERKGCLDHYARIAELDIDSKTGSAIITAFA